MRFHKKKYILVLFMLLACFFCAQPSQAASSRIRGIDVSRYQGTINWEKVKKAGIDFTMIGVGYVIDGVRQSDPKFEYNIKNAIEAGVEVGVYIYSHATTESEARAEADFVLNQIDGYKISYPVAFDIEDTVHLGLSTKERTDLTIAFLEEIEEAGYYPMIYASEYWFNSNMDLSRLTRYDKWVARWGSSISFQPLSMWQYSSTGRVNGINTAVDLDYSYKDYSKIITPRTTPKTRKKKTGWQNDGKHYWFVEKDGSYVKNAFRTIAGRTYYFDSDGYRVTGWKKIKGKYYYFTKKGVMKTGWLTLSGKTYYLSPSTGARKTGWIKVSGKKYYLNSKGVRQYGWLSKGGKKYFLNLKSGSMRTGWMTYQGKTYYFSKQTGQMRKGWLTFGEKKYYMKKDGSRAKGWQKISGDWYYFSKKNGVMKKDGKIGRYRFDENGVCINR